ncbi:hypothetical protein [uncultured Bdellovibrio sp.]|uniref:hypothetical protein n=1 Tax=Bdellovibrio sp. HCB-162 TaxID=3394234 RepID=UPI0025F348CD|nr:hypothetical protein [uncultured Bdellovibrio sp.]
MTAMKKAMIVLVLVLGMAYLAFSKMNSSVDLASNEEETSYAPRTFANSSPAKNLPPADAANVAKVEEFHEMTVTDSYYTHNAYLKPFMSDEGVAKSFYKAKEFFKESPNAEHIAVWIAMGNILDSNPEYGELLEYSIGKINENSRVNLSVFENATKTLTPDDSFIRSQLLNIVNQMNVTSEDKVRFFGKEISRPAALDAEGRWSPDSLNITTALVLLKNNNAAKADVVEYMKESLRVNQSQKIKGKLLTRFATYFPEAMDDLR